MFVGDYLEYHVYVCTISSEELLSWEDNHLRICQDHSLSPFFQLQDAISPVIGPLE